MGIKREREERPDKKHEKKKRKMRNEDGLWNIIIEIEQFYKQRLVNDIVERR